MTIATFITLTVTSAATPASGDALTTTTTAAAPAKKRTKRCPDTKIAVAHYRYRYSEHQHARGIDTGWPIGRRPRSCPDARYLVKVWKPRAYRARVMKEKWLRVIALHTLNDVSYGDGNRAWLSAVVEVQRPYPGTQGWLVTCSWAEGKHGRWVVHGGGDYYEDAEYAKGGREVGGNMQYTYGTFKGHFRRALEDVLARRYRLPGYLRVVSTWAWRSALGQALAAAWARSTGNDDEHWKASWGSGC